MCISIGHLLALVTSALCVRKLFLLSQTERVTHWGTLKSGGLSESERHLVGPIVHIPLTSQLMAQRMAQRMAHPQGRNFLEQVRIQGGNSDGLRKLDLSQRAER